MNNKESLYFLGNYFANRSWKGLNDEHLDEDTDMKCKPGLEGTAVGYTSEKN